MPVARDQSINQSTDQMSIAPTAPAKQGSVARQPNQCSSGKLKKQFRNISRPLGAPVSKGEGPSPRDVSLDIS